MIRALDDTWTMSDRWWCMPRVMTSHPTTLQTYLAITLVLRLILKTPPEQVDEIVQRGSNRSQYASLFDING